MIAIASDHAGFMMKNRLKDMLTEKGFELKDYGTFTDESCDYPVYAKALCEGINSGECGFGILVCGTGVGMSIAANKQKGIRAAVCTDGYMAEYCRLHNDANVICLGARVISLEMAFELCEIFLKTRFEGGKHERRVNMYRD